MSHAQSCLNEANLIQLCQRYGNGETHEVDINWHVTQADCRILGLKLSARRSGSSVKVEKIGQQRIRISISQGGPNSFTTSQPLSTQALQQYDGILNHRRRR